MGIGNTCTEEFLYDENGQQLTTTLMDLLKASKTRVVALSSSGHALSPFNFDDPDFTSRDYDKWAAYGQAKTATALFAVEMANRFGNDGIVTVAVHPGVIKTELQRHLSEAEEEYVLSMSAEQGEIRSVEAGAASIVWAAVAANVFHNNGSYIANCSIANAFCAPHASSAEDAARLWNVTEKLVATNR